MQSPAVRPAQKPTRRIFSMKGLHYIGLDVHKKSISYVIKTYAAELVGRGQVAAHRSLKPGFPSVLGLSGGSIVAALPLAIVPWMPSSFLWRRSTGQGRKGTRFRNTAVPGTTVS